MNVIISCYALSPCLGKKEREKGRERLGGGGDGGREPVDKKLRP